MRKFRVNVNGTSYEIEVEEVTGSLPQETAGKARAEDPAPAAIRKAASANQQNVLAPMPGSIVEVKTKAGSSIKKGEVLLILEAMKMENEIVAPRDCSVVSVNVTKGTTVNAGDVLCVIE
ncbi:MAG: Glutaconyl-CoA decarboxylase subunit gamma [Firmicutes bacterium ADurb.Bin182]|nr:MAG: Glutaconyl-CoA decarboxylase subunit gamma [Firmicutes bacterium ADurb.Bin182]